VYTSTECKVVKCSVHRLQILSLLHCISAWDCLGGGDCEHSSAALKCQFMQSLRVHCYAFGRENRIRNDQSRRVCKYCSEFLFFKYLFSDKVSRKRRFGGTSHREEDTRTPPPVAEGSRRASSVASAAGGNPSAENEGSQQTVRTQQVEDGHQQQVE
jgi:hypothetical protein